MAVQKEEWLMEMEEQILQTLQEELNLPRQNIQRTLSLLQEGNTVPFVARYRKEATGGLDEEEIRTIAERHAYLEALWKRKEEVIRLIGEQGQLTEELAQKIRQAKKLQEVEDYYLPYRPKRRTRATVAKEKGLEPLAQWLLTCPKEVPLEEAGRYLSAEYGLTDPMEALQGAMDIIAEWMAEQAHSRQWIREYTLKQGKLIARLKKPDKDPKELYRTYYDFESPLNRMASHRVLAINRAEGEDVLKVSIAVDQDKIIAYLLKNWVKDENSPAAALIAQAAKDSYQRLIAPSIEREIRRQLTETAEEQAIRIFSRNLKALLMEPPVRGKTVLGIDPAFRTGCKLAVVDPTGKVQAVDVIYPVPPHNKREEARLTLLRLISQHQVDVIAIGNGTASRETEQFIAQFIGEETPHLAYVIVSEAGASVYSASPLAREEFPQLDVAERSAISIARRLQDPLAELVKIDPQSIGVGQYQHDVSPNRLKESLSFVVETAVNQVGVDVNTASVSLLEHVSGLNKGIAQKIVRYRDEHGPFLNRKELLKVPGLGAKTFQQAAGFLRIFDGTDPFDQTPIHPESYREAERLLKELGFSKGALGTEELRRALQDLAIPQWSRRLGVGEPTLADIVEALQRPRRDPRDELPPPLFRKDILHLEDLKPGMKLRGTVRNVVDFGAFVDIGVEQDGLVHISELSTAYVRHPFDVVGVGDVVTVWVKEVDLKRERISLTMIDPEGEGEKSS